VTFIPSQGFRHAASLLLTNGARAIPADASPETIQTAIVRLASELAALADDTRAPAGAAAWLVAELNTIIDRLPHSFDRAAAKAGASTMLVRIAAREPRVESRDLFLIYVPEDRLPIAAPLAIELTKRRVTIAFAEYEVSTVDELATALAHGLAHHLGGVVLRSAAFERAGCSCPPASERIQIIEGPASHSVVANLAAWAKLLRLSKS
jgi:hypothetical protein